jgi:hypothetical protein
MGVSTSIRPESWVLVVLARITSGLAGVAGGKAVEVVVDTRVVVEIAVVVAVVVTVEVVPGAVVTDEQPASRATIEATRTSMSAKAVLFLLPNFKMIPS